MLTVVFETPGAPPQCLRCRGGPKSILSQSLSCSTSVCQFGPIRPTNLRTSFSRPHLRTTPRIPLLPSSPPFLPSHRPPRLFPHFPNLFTTFGSPSPPLSSLPNPFRNYFPSLPSFYYAVISGFPDPWYHAFPKFLYYALSSE